MTTDPDTDNATSTKPSNETSPKPSSEDHTFKKYMIGVGIGVTTALLANAFLIYQGFFVIMVDDLTASKVADKLLDPKHKKRVFIGYVREDHQTEITALKKELEKAVNEVNSKLEELTGLTREEGALTFTGKIVADKFELKNGSVFGPVDGGSQIHLKSNDGKYEYSVHAGGTEVEARAHSTEYTDVRLKYPSQESIDDKANQAPPKWAFY